MKNRKGEKYKLGFDAELTVAKEYTKKSYVVIQQRFKTQYGEIDLIAIKDNTVAFIEVKARNSNVFQDCVGKKQILRNVSAAKVFLEMNPQYNEMDIRYDLALVRGDQVVEEIIEGAITEDS
jgi:putative endonuclease